MSSKGIFKKAKDMYFAYSIPKEHRFDSLNASMHKLKVVYLAMSIFCLGEVLFTYLFPLWAMDMNGNMRLYFMFFWLFTLVGFISTWAWTKGNRFSIKHRTVTAELIIWLSILVFSFLVVFSPHLSQTPPSASSFESPVLQFGHQFISFSALYASPAL